MRPFRAVLVEPMTQMFIATQLSLLHCKSTFNNSTNSHRTRLLSRKRRRETGEDVQLEAELARYIFISMGQDFSIRSRMSRECNPRLLFVSQ